MIPMIPNLEALVGPVDEDDYPEFPGAQMRPSQAAVDSPAPDVAVWISKHLRSPRVLDVNFFGG